MKLFEPRKLFTLLYIVVCLSLFSCFANQALLKRYKGIQTSISENKAQEKIDEILKDNSKYDKYDQLLYYLDLGMLYFYAKKYELSIEHLETAEKLSDKYYTESVTQNISTFLLNDGFSNYKGEPFELLYINVIKALNFINLKKPESAMIEIRRGQAKIKILENRYADEKARLKKSVDESIKKNIKSGSGGYSVDIGDVPIWDNATLRALSALLYRMDGEVSDMIIDKKAIEDIWKNKSIYPFNKPDLSKISTKVGEDSAFVDIVLMSDFTGSKVPLDLNIISTGSALVVYAQGNSKPFMSAIAISAPKLSFSLSVPVFERANEKIKRVELYINNEFHGELKPLEKTTLLAENMYENSKTYIYLKSIVRSFIKSYVSYMLQKKAEKKYGKDSLGSLGTFLVTSSLNSLSENADIRHWRLLPNSWNFSEKKLPYGTHNIEIKAYDKNGKLYKIIKKVVNLSDENKQSFIVDYIF